MAEYNLGVYKPSGRIVHFTEVKRGKACDCVCPGCGKDFLTAQGPVKPWHFKHADESTTCKGGQETALHLLAKEIITENVQILLPVYGKVLYENAIKEQFFETVKPDVSAIINGQNIFFEILVTHAVGEVKDGFYITGKYKSVEIDLQNYSFTNRKDLENEILNNTLNKRIIFWEKKIEKEKSADKSLCFYIIAGLSAVLAVLIFVPKILKKKKRSKEFGDK